MRSRAWAVALLLGLLVASGCGRLNVQERSFQLSDELEVYAKAVRWGNFRSARQHLRHRDGRAVAPPDPLLARIRVTRYRLSGTQPNADATETQVTFELRFFHHDTNREVSALDQQTWWWDDEQRRWYLDGTLPDFSAALSRPGAGRSGSTRSG